MPSVQKIIVSLAFAATVLAQSQISDGQIQAPTSAPVKQIPDGQVQAPTSAPVSQIPDGQIQAPTSAPAPSVSQIADGQIQAPTSAPAPSVTPIKQISDGQLQAPSTGVMAPSANGTFTSPAPTAAFTGAANILGWSQEMAVAAVGAAAGFAML